MESAHREIDPLVNYAFKVEVGGLQVARFNNVDGLNYEVEMIEYRSSEDPNLPRFRQGRRKAQRVTFKRGVLVGGNVDLLTWLQEVEKGTVSSKDITVTIGAYGAQENESGGQDNAWVLHDCMPTKWSLGSLDSNSNSALIESLEVVASFVSKS
jgi:phage tail-like protein